MGVDVSHIVRHEFRHTDDVEASMDFVEQTIECLKRNLLINCSADKFGLHDEFYDNEHEIIFRLPVYDVEFTLRNGFWQIESYFHYCQIVMHDGDNFWLRRMIFDIAKALGQSEAWHAAEYYTWNNDLWDKNPNCSFDEWLKNAEKTYGSVIPEFNQDAIMAQGDVHIPDYCSIYHDSFKECLELFDRVQSKLNDFRLLGIDLQGGRFFRCEKNNQLFIIDSQTLEPLFDGSVDEIQCFLNRQDVVVVRNGKSQLYVRKSNTYKPLFDEPVDEIKCPPNRQDIIVVKNGMSAVYDTEGVRLTNFEKIDFEWDWDKIYKKKRTAEFIKAGFGKL